MTTPLKPMTPAQLENALEAQLRDAQAPGDAVLKIKPPADLWDALQEYFERHPKATFAPKMMDWLSKNEFLSVKQWEALMDMLRRDAKAKIVADLSACTVADVLAVPDPDNYQAPAYSGSFLI